MLIIGWQGWKYQQPVWPCLTLAWQKWWGASLHPCESVILGSLQPLLEWAEVAPQFSGLFAAVEQLLSKSFLSCYTAIFLVFWLERAGFFYGLICLCPLAFLSCFFSSKSEDIWSKKTQKSEIRKTPGNASLSCSLGSVGLIWSVFSRLPVFRGLFGVSRPGSLAVLSGRK